MLNAKLTNDKHKDKTFNLLFLRDGTQAIDSSYEYNGNTTEQFTLPIKNVGEPLYSFSGAEGDDVYIEKDVTFDLKMTGFFYNRVAGCKKGKTYSIKCVKDGKWNYWVEEIEGETKTPHINKPFNYAQTKNGEMPIVSEPVAYVNEDDKWLAIDRRKNLNITKAQAMNLAVKTALEFVKYKCEDCGKADFNKKFDKYVLSYRDKYYEMMAGYNPKDPLDNNTEEEDALPF